MRPVASIAHVAFIIMALAAGSARAMPADDRVQLADGLFSRGMYDLAQREYSSLSTNQPPVKALDSVLFRLAESERLLQRRAEAIAAYKRVFTEFPDSTFAGRAAYRHAELHVVGGQYLEAVNYLRAVVAKNPSREIAAPALYHLGYSQAKINLQSDPMDAYRREVTEHPQTMYFGYACLALAELLKDDPHNDEEVTDLLKKASRQTDTPRVAAEGWFQLGELAFGRSDFVKSADAYEQLLVRYPEDERSEQARLQAAWSFLHTKRYADALKIAEKATLRASGDLQPEWHYLQANCNRQMKNLKEARGDYEHVLKEHADSSVASSAAYELALMEFDAGAYSNVVRLVSTLQPTNALALDVDWLLAESFSKLGRTEDAFDAYTRVEKGFPESDRAPLAAYQRCRILLDLDRKEEAVAACLSLAGTFPKHTLAPVALHAAAKEQFALKKPAEGLALLDRLSRDYPGYASSGQVLYEKAQAEMEAGDDASAIKSLDAVIKLSGTNALAGDAHYLMGVLHERGGRSDVAEFHYRSAISKSPSEKLTLQSQLRRVAVLQSQGKQDDAASVLNDVVAKDAAGQVDAAVLDWLARWNLAAGDHEAVVMAAKALRKQTNTPAWTQIGWYLEGRALQAMDKLDEAKVAYEKAVAVQAETREGVEAAMYLGQVAMASKDIELAKGSYARAAELAGSDELIEIRAKSYFGLAEAAEVAGEWDEASRYFMSVAVLFDDDSLTPESLYRAAVAFGKLKKSNEQEQALGELQQRYPDSTWSKKKVGE